MAAEDGGDGEEEVLGGELFVFAVGGPADAETDPLAVLEPVGDLFDGGLFEVVGERGLAGIGGGAGEDVTAGIRHSRHRE